MKYSLAGGEAKGREQAAEQGVLLKDAEKGVAVLRFPRAAGRREQGAARPCCEWVTQKTNVGYGVVCKDGEVRVMIEQLWDWWGLGMGKCGCLLKGDAIRGG